MVKVEKAGYFLFSVLDEIDRINAFCVVPNFYFFKTNPVE